MGGDHGPRVTVSAALHILARQSDIRLILVGDQATLEAAIGDAGARFGDRLNIQHASQVVAMDELPSQALRGKKDSSMRVAINLVKEGRAHACVSAGNTGALMATARFVLKTLPGIDRPAICTILPTVTGHTHVLDLGANIDSTAEHLFEFAVMGSVLASAVDNNPRPSVGLLNIGEEEIKGNEQVKQAARLLGESELNYIGFVEGDGIYLDPPDVVVCDGFIGNVMLKTSEGVAKMFVHYLKREFRRNIFSKLSALIAMPVLKSFGKRLDPRAYNGASLLGLQGIVIKSHGSADDYAFGKAILVARTEAIKNVPRLISDKLEAQLKRKEAS
ncbi:MAG: phosphate acyltransferase PlsX [Gammaproteobacteria bacterium]|nr:phosphate acyltransferase PlsX [Gammaproteobacteria bacterium]